MWSAYEVTGVIFFIPFCLLFSVSIQLDANAALVSAEYICHKLDLHSQQLTEHSRGTELHIGEKTRVAGRLMVSL